MWKLLVELPWRHLDDIEVSALNRSEKRAMAISYQRTTDYICKLVREHGIVKLANRLRPKPGKLPSQMPGHAQITHELLNRRWSILPAAEAARAHLLDPHTADEMDVYQHNIENFIGTAKMPVGIAGPLRVNGLFAQGDYYVPLATTEAALVASYSRGAKIISECGGASAALLSEGVSRSPALVPSRAPRLSIGSPCREPSWTLSRVRAQFVGQVTCIDGGALRMNNHGHRHAQQPAGRPGVAGEPVMLGLGERVKAAAHPRGPSRDARFGKFSRRLTKMPPIRTT